MRHNPLATELQARALQLKELHERRAQLLAELEWYRSFDRPRVADDVQECHAKCVTLVADHADAAQRLAAAERDTDRLKRQAEFGFDPTYWFSSERRKAKAQLARQPRIVTELKAREKRLASELAATQRLLEARSRDLARFDEFSMDQTEADIARLDAEVPLLQLAHDDLAERKRALDRLLEEPVNVLERLQEEERGVERALVELVARADALEHDIDRASRFDRELSQAANGYERAKIHQACDEELGDGSPRAVIADRRRKVTEAKREIRTAGRRLESLKRNVAKAQDRVAKVAIRGARDVRAIVVDGSNLCYQSGEFIGLAALRPLCDHLVRIFDVTLVFDASIRRKLGRVSDDDLRHTFAGATVHVVATKTKADETILAAATDPYVFVLSNDRFADYRDKPTVSDGRLIRHEIINGRVLVHDLDINLSFAAKDSH